MKFSGKFGNGRMNKCLNFGDDPDPGRDTGKTCLDGGIHCPSASIHYYYYSLTLATLQALYNVVGCSDIGS